MATDYKKNAQEAKAIAKSNPAAAKVIAQATKTGEGLSNNELTFIKNNASSITAKTNPVAFLGTLQSRIDANARVAGGTSTGQGTTTTTGNVVDPSTIYAQARDDAERRSAYAILEDTFKAYNLEELVPEIKKYLQQNLSAAEATLQLRQTPTYKTRFKGNEGRLAKGLPAYSPAEYLQAEETYANLLNSNNLSGLSNKETFSKLISGGVSPAEAQDRINNVFNKIDNASDDVKNELGRYFSQFGVGDATVQRNQIAEAILSGEDPAMKLESNIKKAQLRAGATAAKYTLPEERVATVEKLLSEAGVSNVYAAGQQGFQTLAQIEPQAEALSARYQTEAATQEELQKEAFLGLKSERRRKAEESEKAAFKGAAGTTQASLAQQSKGSF
jgi:hypothetical protein